MSIKNELQKYIFGEIFLVSNKLQTIGDEFLEEVTMKQWFFLAIIDQFFRNSEPSITEISNVIGSSRQNVKQIALKLEKKGFIVIKKDEKDSRILRVSLTERCYDYWNNRYEKDEDFLQHIYKGMEQEELIQMLKSLEKFYENISSFKMNKDEE